MWFPALYPFVKLSESDARLWTSGSCGRECQYELEDTADDYVYEGALQERRKESAICLDQFITTVSS